MCLLAQRPSPPPPLAPALVVQGKESGPGFLLPLVAVAGGVAVLGASGAVYMAYKALMQKAADDAIGFSPTSNRVRPAV